MNDCMAPALVRSGPRKAKPPPRHAIRFALAAGPLFAAAALGGCAVGPNFTPPSAPAVTAYVTGPATLPTAGQADVAQHLLWGEALDQRWWTAFHSKALDETVKLAIADSPTLDTARATLAQAQEAIRVARGGLYPRIDADASAERSRARGVGSAGAARATTANLFTIGPTVSYTLDLFGGTRREIEAQTALADYQHDQLAAAYLALTGNTVTQALTSAGVREQARAVGDIISVDERNVELVVIARGIGKAAATDELTARSQLAADLALLPPLEQQLSAADHALAILVGKTPVQWQPPPFDFDDLALPTDVPAALPSVWLQSRPDVNAAQAQLHAASAAIGIATAQLYPNITLSAGWTQAAATMGLFDSANGLWTVAAALTAPLFHGGALNAQKRAAVDAFEAQLGSYRQTVLEAFGQVADTLRALQHDAEALAAQRTALDTAQASLALLQERYRVGSASLVDVLQAQRLFAQARVGYAKAKGQRYVDSAQWFTVMGGAAQAWAQRQDRPDTHRSAASP